MFDDDEGWWTRTVSWEGGHVVSQRCPSCGRFMARDTFKAKSNWFTDEWKTEAHCGKCGDVEPVFLCWDGEYD